MSSIKAKASRKRGGAAAEDTGRDSVPASVLKPAVPAASSSSASRTVLPSPRQGLVATAQSTSSAARSSNYKNLNPLALNFLPDDEEQTSFAAEVHDGDGNVTCPAVRAGEGEPKDRKGEAEARAADSLPTFEDEVASAELVDATFLKKSTRSGSCGTKKT
mmetsp:Transcript_20289/g.51262  ORF Transcript_20289/g.51262 Transcript_20289/m.51262 type:complete len:161 (-) Transcript_20289:1580-2062(-)